MDAGKLLAGMAAGHPCLGHPVKKEKAIVRSASDVAEGRPD